jgi:hypothetical protein
MQQSRSLRPNPLSAEILQQDKQHLALACENVLIVLWRSAPDAATCRAIYDLGAQLATTHPTGKISVVSILRAASEAPPASVRRALEDLHEDPSGIVHRVAVVLPDTGFIAAAIRSIVLAATQRAVRRQGHGVFPALAQAVSWALEDLPTASGSRLSEAALLEAVGSLS